MTRPADSAKTAHERTQAGLKSAPASDRRMELVMGRLLQIGVTLASAVVLIGGVLYLRAHATQTVSFSSFHPESAALRSPLETFAGVRHRDPAAIIQLGVLLLIATPVARVLFAVAAFTLERDWLYVSIATAVLLVLLLGLSGVI